MDRASNTTLFIMFNEFKISLYRNPQTNPTLVRTYGDSLKPDSAKNPGKLKTPVHPCVTRNDLTSRMRPAYIELIL